MDASIAPAPPTRRPPRVLWPGLRPAPDADGHAVNRRRDRHFRWSLAVADAAAALFVVAFCVGVLSDDRLNAWVLAAPVLVIVIAKVQGLYDRDELLIRKSTIEEAPKLFQLSTLYALILYVVSSLYVEGAVTPQQVGSIWLGMWLLLVAFRAAARGVAGRVSTTERCIVLGDAEVAEKLRAKVRGRLDVDFIGSVPMVHASTDPRQLAEFLRDADVHRVVIAPDGHAQPEVTLDLIRAAKATGVRVSIVPGVLEVVGSAVVFDDVYGMTLLGVRRFGLTQSSAWMKRAMDLTGALAMLVVVSPLMAAVALLVKLDSPGPVFFRQPRIGRDGREFPIFKFRTMVDGADAMKAGLRELNEAGDGMFKIKDDPRVTRTGTFLRRTCIDELPQLFNVVRGEMSLVGPRPLIQDEDRLIKGLDRRRSMLTPGMTGPWQVLGDNQASLSEITKLDYLYLAGWSLWTDVKLMIRTVLLVVRRGSA